MKKLIVLLLSFFVLGSTQAEKRKFIIDGKTPELKEGTMVLILNRFARVDTLAQTAIVNGEFHFEGELEEAQVAMLRVAGYEGGFVFLLDSDAPYEMELWKSKPSTIKGGYLQNELNTYQRIVAEANGELGRLKSEMEKANAQKRFKTSSELKKKLEKYRADVQAELEEIIEKNRDNLFSVYIQAMGIENLNLEALKQRYEKLSEKARQTQFAQTFVARIQLLENITAGASAPDFSLQTPDGEVVKMYDVKGKLKIIDFWASWCGPCRLENPNMVKLYNDYKDKGLTIISVSLDEKKDKWVEAIKKDGLSWIHLSDLKGWKSEVVKKYNVDAVPAIFILDENNRILGKQLRGEKLRAFVEDYLSKVN